MPRISPLTNYAEVRRESKARCRTKIVPWYVVTDAARVSNGYLLACYYDADRNSAVLAFYDVDERRVKYWFDKSGHKPYFLVRERNGEIIKKIPQNLRQRIVETELVKKFDLLRSKHEILTRVKVSDPLAVRELRGYFAATWESDIKYHQNYIYDLGLVPGTRYEVREKLLVPKLDSIESLELDELMGEAGSLSKDVMRGLASILESEPPMPTMVALDVEVFTPLEGRVPDPKTAPYPVISAALVDSDGRKIVLMLSHERLRGLRADELRDFELLLFDSEAALLEALFAELSNYPVVFTFNGDNFDLPYLLRRAERLGFRPEEAPIRRAQDYYTFKTGIHIDLYHVFDNKALKTYAFGGTYRETTLDAVARALLGVGKLETGEVVSQLSAEELARYNLNDALLTLRLAMWRGGLTWKLLVVLSRLAKTCVEDLSRSQISAWIRNMLYWEHRRRGYLIPRREDLLREKGETKSKAAIKGKKYAGAIVLDPPVGVFFDVRVLDFASLYPSIIKLWNLSYETVNPSYECRSVREVPEVGHRVCLDREGIMSSIIGALRDLRVKVYKRRSKAEGLPEDKRQWYSVVQSSLKVFLNASYGVFGSESFALYTPPVAESVTAVGRYLVKRTLEKASRLGLLVIYGDTDSMFVWSPSEELLENFIEEIERESGLDLEVDKVFKYVAFSGLKKNYLGLTRESEVIIKGLLGKKRNQPPFVKRAFEEVIRELSLIERPEDFERRKSEIVGRIKRVFDALRNREYTLNELAFNVIISKPLDEYDKNTPQHVKAAEMLRALGRRVGKGDIISYVKVRGREGVKPVQLAKLAEIDFGKYVEVLRSTFEQVLLALNVEWKEIEGVLRLEYYMNLTPTSGDFERR
ncbi:MAG: DNA-directed DNA polymerase I [Fervidicoccaceae archaeon]